MNANITTAQFELQSSWFIKEIENISEEQSNVQVNSQLNPVKWVVGHILNTRMNLLNIITGKEHDENYRKHFGKGSSNIIDSSSPTMGEIKLKWDSVSTELIECLINISDDKLLSAPPFQTSIPDKTLLGLIVFMAAHEALHLGQLSVLKKLVNKN